MDNTSADRIIAEFDDMPACLDEDLDILQFEDFINSSDLNIPVQEPERQSSFGQPMDAASGLSTSATGPPLGPFPNRLVTLVPAEKPHDCGHGAVCSTQPSASQAPLYSPQLLGNSSTQLLPDSPPDSGSEPYSPPDGTRPSAISGWKLEDSIRSSAGSASNFNSSTVYQPHQSYITTDMSHNNSGYINNGFTTDQMKNLNGQYNAQLLSNPQQNFIQTHSSLSSLQPQTLLDGNAPIHMSPLQGLSSPESLSPAQQNSPRMSISPNLPRADKAGFQLDSAGFGDSKLNLDGIKKARLSSDTQSITASSTSTAFTNIKQEPVETEDTGSGFQDPSFQVIKWLPYLCEEWHCLVDQNGKALPKLFYQVDADKGFNYSVLDDAFVCQKKNHFQITVQMCLQGTPKYILVNDQPKPIDSYYVHFHGVKMEATQHRIKVEQSQSDRSKKSFHPVKVDLVGNQTHKITVGRLHFSETTNNNMRKKNRPNPDQRYFNLVVSLKAHCENESFVIAAHICEKIVVRASNPGQFESDVDNAWMKSPKRDGIFHMGPVGINTENPDEMLTVAGNLKLMGQIVQPSDMRAKKDIHEIDSEQQLQNVSKLKLYNYAFRDSFAEQIGLPEDARKDTGVLAQEVRRVIPDAVKESSDVKLPGGDVINKFLVVNKDRIFMENIGAVKALHTLTGNLENRIDQLEDMNKRLNPRKKPAASVRSNGSVFSFTSFSSFGRCSVGSRECNRRRPCSVCHHQNKKKKPLFQNRILQIAIVALIIIMAFCVISMTALFLIDRKSPMAESIEKSPLLDNTTHPWHPENATSANLFRTSTFTQKRIPTTSFELSSAVSKGVPLSLSESASPPIRHTVRPTSRVTNPIKRPTIRPTRGLRIGFTTRPTMRSTSWPVSHGVTNRQGMMASTSLSRPVGAPTIARGGEMPPAPEQERRSEDRGRPVADVPIQEIGENEKYEKKNSEKKVARRKRSVFNSTASTPTDVQSYFEKLENFGLISPRCLRQACQKKCCHLASSVPSNDFAEERQISTNKNRPTRELANQVKPVELVLHDLNLTINDRYCADEICQNAKENLLRYYIPLDPTFPTDYITIEFFSDQLVIAELCSEVSGDSCLSRNVSSFPMDDLTWSLAAGYYSSIIYHIRVGHPPSEAKDLCRLQSGDYLDYQLSFFRKSC